MMSLNIVGISNRSFIHGCLSCSSFIEQLSIFQGLPSTIAVVLMFDVKHCCCTWSANHLLLKCMCASKHSAVHKHILSIKLNVKSYQRTGSYKANLCFNLCSQLLNISNIAKGRVQRWYVRKFRRGNKIYHHSISQIFADSSQLDSSYNHCNTVCWASIVDTGGLLPQLFWFHYPCL